jgi:hypothetical protein
MKLDDEAKDAVRELADAVNAAIKKSEIVAAAIERLHEIGYSPNLTLKLEVGLDEIGGDLEMDSELDLTDEDLRELRRMKIRIE